MARTTKTPRRPRAQDPQPREKVAGIILSKEAKVFTWTGYDGQVKVLWKKLSAPEKNAILGSLPTDPRTGQVRDEMAAQIAIVTKAIISWQGIFTESSEPCPVEPVYVADLPSQIFNTIFNANMLGVRTGDSPLPV